MVPRSWDAPLSSRSRTFDRRMLKVGTLDAVTSTISNAKRAPVPVTLLGAVNALMRRRVVGGCRGWWARWGR